MHPILARKERLALYLVAWAPIGLGLASMFVLIGDAGWVEALAVALPASLLFNSLHSISALTTADPAGARRMSLLLGEFLRLSLKLGARERIPLAEEMALVERFLGIEQVRFGDRLRASVTLDPDAVHCEVPALLLQPLVENAVRHGIAELVDGGHIDVQAGRQGDRLTILLENPCDPERRSRSGAGVGLANVRGRLAAAFGADARVTAAERDGRFHVELSLPAIEADARESHLPAPAAGLATGPLT